MSRNENRTADRKGIFVVHMQIPVTEVRNDLASDSGIGNKNESRYCSHGRGVLKKSARFAQGPSFISFYFLNFSFLVPY